MHLEEELARDIMKPFLSFKSVDLVPELPMLFDLRKSRYVAEGVEYTLKQRVEQW